MSILYAREIVNSNVKLEGSLSSARAMAQLRQFYARIMDPEDRTGLSSLWETKRQDYVNKLGEKARKKKMREEAEAFAREMDALTSGGGMASAPSTAPVPIELPSTSWADSPRQPSPIIGVPGSLGKLTFGDKNQIKGVLDSIKDLLTSNKINRARACLQ